MQKEGKHVILDGSMLFEKPPFPFWMSPTSMICMLGPDEKLWKQKDLCVEAPASCILLEKLWNPSSIRLSLSLLATGNRLPCWEHLEVVLLLLWSLWPASSPKSLYLKISKSLISERNLLWVQPIFTKYERAIIFSFEDVCIELMVAFY